MSAAGVTDALVEAIASDRYDFIVANYREPGHGRPHRRWSATIAALEVVDACLGRVVAAVDAVDAADRRRLAPLLAITADHGNADGCATPTGGR